MKGSTAKLWLSEDLQAFFDWVQAVAQIRAKTPMEMAALTAQLRSGPEGERQPVFGDGRQDYMMQRYKNLALIQVSGTLVKHDSVWNRYFGLVSYDEIRRAALMALQDQAVEGITLLMNTPGGAAAGADAMAGFFGKVNKTKPLYAFAESDMCSGGYYLGAPAREIYAQRAAMVGSIGVIMVHYDYLKMYQEAGIKPTVFRAGEFKALGSSMEHLDEKATEVIQKTLNDYFKMFNEHVVEHRGYASVADLLATGGDGRVFMAEEAKDAGLVDQVAELEDALEMMSGKAMKASGRRTQVAVGKSYASTNAQGNDDMPKEEAKAAAAAGEALTPEQLAALAAGIGQGDPAGAGQLDAGAGGQGDDKPAGQEGGDPAVTQEQPPAPQQLDLDKLITLSTELGQVKAQLQAKDGEIAQLKADSENQMALVDRLKEVATVAINIYQVRLGFQPSDVKALSPEQSLELFSELSASFSERFKAGVKSAPTQAPIQPASLSPAANAARGMTGKL